MPQHNDAAKLKLWKERVDQYNKSKLTVVQFCQSIRCSITTFYQWKRKIEHGSRSAFFQIATVEPKSSDIQIKLPSGITIIVPIQAIESLSDILERVA